MRRSAKLHELVGGRKRVVAPNTLGLRVEPVKGGRLRVTNNGDAPIVIGGSRHTIGVNRTAVIARQLPFTIDERSLIFA